MQLTEKQNNNGLGFVDVRSTRSLKKARIYWVCGAALAFSMKVFLPFAAQAGVSEEVIVFSEKGSPEILLVEINTVKNTTGETGAITQLIEATARKVTKTSSGIEEGESINILNWTKDLSTAVGLRGGSVRVGDKLHAFLRFNPESSLYEPAYGTFGFRSTNHEWPDFEKNPYEGEFDEVVPPAS